MPFGSNRGGRGREESVFIYPYVFSSAQAQTAQRCSLGKIIVTVSSTDPDLELSEFDRPDLDRTEPQKVSEGPSKHPIRPCRVLACPLSNQRLLPCVPVKQSEIASDRTWTVPSPKKSPNIHPSIRLGLASDSHLLETHSTSSGPDFDLRPSPKPTPKDPPNRSSP